MAQQLAYLGVIRYALIDDDAITESSLNRVIGAVPQDVPSKTPKVRAAERLIKSLQPEAAVTVLGARVTRSSEDAAATVRYGGPMSSSAASTASRRVCS